MNAKQRKRARREEKLRQRTLDQKSGQNRSYMFYTMLVILLSGLFIGFLAKYSEREVLPPTDIAGHVESAPESYILDKPMPLAQQKHMLEHADGIDRGTPGVVINYNCDDFECDDDLISNLENLVRKNVGFVYLAPFKGMTEKIAITRYGEIETFDEFNEEALTNFIGN